MSMARYSLPDSFWRWLAMTLALVAGLIVTAYVDAAEGGKPIRRNVDPYRARSLPLGLSANRAIWHDTSPLVSSAVLLSRGVGF